MDTWLHAFLLTQAIEAPLYLWAGRRVHWLPRCLAAVMTTAVTHPVLWFCFPWNESSYWHSVIVGECAVVIKEAAVLHIAGFSRPLLTSLAVNALSVAIGLGLSDYL
jgi:hypothetical protein